MKLDRAAVTRLIPHGGAMCLLDSVVEWDLDRIICHSERHRALDNPLRMDDRLAAVNAIEFAAQAMAVHHRLTHESAAIPHSGVLISVRRCVMVIQQLDECSAPLRIEATRIAASDDALTYSFAVGSEGAPLVTGRASVLLLPDVQ
jgi:predicted hotdog family 3-hydroxylacyl-ACP dehydratase